MRLLRSFPPLAFTVVLLGIVGLCVAQKSAGLLLVAGILAAISWYVTEGPRGRSLPRWTSNVLVIAVSLNVFVDLFAHRDDVMGALGRFVVWLTLIKLYERKAPRDYAQLLSLSLLLIFLGCLQSNDLMFAAVLLMYAVLGLYVLLLFQLHASYEHTRAARLGSAPEGYRLLPSLQPIFGRRPGLHFKSLMIGVGAAGLLSSAVVFVIFPREIGRGLIGTLRVPSSDRLTALANEVNLTSGTRITESRKVVLNLRLLDSHNERFHDDRPLRLRGAALDRYEGAGRWTATPSGNARLITTEPPAFAPLGTSQAEEAPTLTQEFEVLSPSRTLFSVYVPVSIATKDARRFRFDPVGQTLEYAGPGRLRRYTIKAQPAPSDETLRSLSPHLPARQGLQEFPASIRALAVDLLGSAGLATQAPAAAEQRWQWTREAAEVFTGYLQSAGFDYDLDLRGIVGGASDGHTNDPIVQFLFETRRGHCEYFASALAAMCNCVGIPGRLVIGYVALEYDEASQQYIVRESNAHAWVEVPTGPDRWTTFDTTPPATLWEIHDAKHTLADRLRWIFDRFEAKWSNGFVAFDRESQGRLVRALDLGWSQPLTDALHSTRRWMARVNRAFYLGPAGYIWMGIVAFALLIAITALIKLMRRSVQISTTLRLRHVRGAEYQRMLRQLGFYLDMLTVLKKAGCSKPPWQPPLQYARALADRQPDRAAVVREITEIFYAARYGGRQLSREQLGHVRSLVHRLACALGVKK